MPILEKLLQCTKQIWFKFIYFTTILTLRVSFIVNSLSLSFYLMMMFENRWMDQLLIDV